MSTKVGNGEVVASSFLQATSTCTRADALLKKERALSIFGVGVVVPRHHFVHRVSDQVYVNWILVAEIGEICEINVPVKGRGQSCLLPYFIYVLHNLFLKWNLKFYINSQQNMFSGQSNNKYGYIATTRGKFYNLIKYQVPSSWN